MKAIRANNFKTVLKTCIYTPLLVLLISLNCLTVEKRIFAPEKKFPRTNPEEITISYSAPEKKHIRIGELSVRFNSGYKRETALGMLKKTASEYGADGIILNPIRRVNDRFAVTSSGGDAPDANITLVNYELSGTIYRYLSE